jgi:hypothetical protein
MKNATQNTVKFTRKSDGKEFVKTFASKKDKQRFMSNNYTTYTW